MQTSMLDTTQLNIKLCLLLYGILPQVIGVCGTEDKAELVRQKGAWAALKYNKNHIDAKVRALRITVLNYSTAIDSFGYDFIQYTYCERSYIYSYIVNVVKMSNNYKYVLCYVMLAQIFMYCGGPCQVLSVLYCLVSK